MYSARKAMEKLRTEVLDRAAGKFCLANCGAMLSLEYFWALVGKKEIYGWLSKLWSLFGYRTYQVPYYNRDAKGTIILTTTHMM